MPRCSQELVMGDKKKLSAEDAFYFLEEMRDAYQALSLADSETAKEIIYSVIREYE